MCLRDARTCITVVRVLPYSRLLIILPTIRLPIWPVLTVDHTGTLIIAYFRNCVINTGYSYSLTVFSPSGKLVQIEHALAAVSQGTTSLGIKGVQILNVVFKSQVLNNVHQASNGIVIATEKKSSSILIDDSMIDKVSIICPNIGIVYSGMGPDFRILVDRARKSAQAYWKIYNEYPPTKVLTQEIATIMQQATHSG